MYEDISMQLEKFRKNENIWVEDKKVIIRYNPLNPSESVIFNDFGGGILGYGVEMVTTNYEFQKGANEMMKIVKS